MKKLTYLTALITIAAGIMLSGCQTTEPTPVPEHTTAVLVGIGYTCDKPELAKKGSSLDIATMDESIRFCYSGSITYPVNTDYDSPMVREEYIFPTRDDVLTEIVLQDSYATKQNVKNALKKAVQDPLAIIYFSTKATRIPVLGDPDEPDGYDEAVCLYDGNLLDNEIWEILQTAKGRVFIMFETSYGSSMFRAPKYDPEAGTITSSPMLIDLVAEVENAEKNAATTTNSLNMVCWSASMENEELPESSFGSKFTNVFYFKYSWRDNSYQQVYDKIYKSLSNKQNINKTVIGEDFSDLSMFR